MDGTWRYSEFLNFLVTDSDFTLRRLADEKSSYYPSSSPYLGFDVEYSLVKLFEREIELVRNLVALLKDLNLRYDHNVTQLFTSLDEYSLNYITSDNLRNFLFKNGVELFESDYQAIWKRIDLDRDGRVSLWELKKVFGLTGYYSEGLSTSFSSTKRDILTSTNYGSSIRDSPQKTNKSTYLSPVRQSNNLNMSLSRSYNRDLNKSYNAELTKSPLRDSYSSKFTSYEEDLFIEYLKDTLINERELERLKCELTLKSDFNLGDLYKIFEANRLGYLTASDLKFGMNQFSVYPSIDELNMLIKRYDGSNTLSSYAFNDMFLPIDREYNRVLKNRICLDYHSKCTPDVFSFESRYSVTNLLKALINVENNAEMWRQKFYNIKTFYSRIIYDKIDVLGKNYFTADDLTRNFQINSVFYSSKDLDLLMFRLDKNRDGRISYSEFIDEFSPRSREYLLR